MANNRKSFPLRIDPKLFEEIRKLAQGELRSVNAQIEFLLREAIKRRMRSFRDDESLNDSDLE